MSKSFTVLSLASLTALSSQLSAQDLNLEKITRPLRPAEECKIYFQDFKNWDWNETVDAGDFLGKAGIFGQVEAAAVTDCEKMKGVARAEAGMTVMGGVKYALISGKAEIMSNRKTGKNKFDILIEGVGKTIYKKSLEKNGELTDTIDFPKSTYTKDVSDELSAQYDGQKFTVGYKGKVDLGGELVYVLNNKEVRGFMAIINEGSVTLFGKSGTPVDDKWYKIEGKTVLIDHMPVASMYFKNSEGNTWKAYGGVMYFMNAAFQTDLKLQGRWGSASVDKSFYYPGLHNFWESFHWDKEFTLL